MAKLPLPWQEDEVPPVGIAERCKNYFEHFFDSGTTLMGPNGNILTWRGNASQTTDSSMQHSSICHICGHSACAEQLSPLREVTLSTSSHSTCPLSMNATTPLIPAAGSSATFNNDGLSPTTNPAPYRQSEPSAAPVTAKRNVANLSISVPRSTLNHMQPSSEKLARRFAISAGSGSPASFGSLLQQSVSGESPLSSVYAARTLSSISHYYASYAADLGDFLSTPASPGSVSCQFLTLSPARHNEGHKSEGASTAEDDGASSNQANENTTLPTDLYGFHDTTQSTANTQKDLQGKPLDTKDQPSPTSEPLPSAKGTRASINVSDELLVGSLEAQRKALGHLVATMEKLDDASRRLEAMHEEVLEGLRRSEEELWLGIADGCKAMLTRD